MWLVHVGEWAVGESGVRQISKSHTLALRCNRDYRIGRSEQRADKSFNEIRIEKKSVSRTAGTVLVGDWPEEDGRGEVDYLAAPTLTYINEVTDASKAKRSTAVFAPTSRTPRGSTDTADYVRTNEVDRCVLTSGAFIYLTAGGTDILRFEWRPCVVRAKGGTDKFVEQRDFLAKYGVHLAHKDTPTATHVIAFSLDFHASSLALAVCSAAHIVTEMWLDTLVAALTPPTEGKSLHKFQWPAEPGYMPDVAPHETGPRRDKSWWAPNEERRKIWQGKTILLLCTKDPPLERLYLAASGAKAIALDVCTRPLASPDDCKKRLRPHLDAAARHALAVRAQLERTGVPEARWPDAEEALVIMCTEEALLAYEADKSDVEELMMMPTKSMGIRFTPAPFWWRALTKCDWRDAVVDMDEAGASQSQSNPSQADDQVASQSQARARPPAPSQSAQSSLQSQPPATFIPSTHPEEAATQLQPAAPVHGRKDKAVEFVEREKAATPPPEKAPEKASSTIVKKPLKRRAGNAPVDTFLLPIFATDETDEPAAKRRRGGSPMSGIEETPPRESEGSKDTSSKSKDVTGGGSESFKRGTKLKRRAGGARMSSIFDESLGDSGNAVSQVAVDPLAKYRNTYNKSRGETLEDAVSVEDEPMEEQEDFVQSLLKKQAAASQQQMQQQIKKQKEADATTAAAASSVAVALPATKAAVVHNASASGSRNVAGTAAPRNGSSAETDPTRDESFLQAVGKARKGAKEIDDFDKDFNALKIDKRKKVVPAVVQTAAVTAQSMNYDVLVADLDPEMTGNFVIMEKRSLLRMDRANKEERSGNPEWAGKPNFKKFKKQHVVRRPPVAMALAPATDYGLGGTYWADKQDPDTAPASALPVSYSQSQTQRTGTQLSQATATAAGARGRRRQLPLDEDSDEEGVMLPPSTSRTARTQSSQSTQTQARLRAGEETPAEPPAKGRQRKVPEPKARVTGPVNMSLLSDSDDPVAVAAKRTRRGTSVSSLGDTAGVDELMTARSTRSTNTRSGGAVRRKLLPVDDEDEDQVYGGRTRRH